MCCRHVGISIFNCILLVAGKMLIKIKFKSLLSIMSRYTLNILKGYKEILDFKLTLNPKGGNL